MRKNKNTKALASLFSESENIKLSDSEVDEELVTLGVDPRTLVSEGMALVKKYAQVTTLKVRYDYMPMAAGKPEAVDNEIAKSLKKKRKGKSKK